MARRKERAMVTPATEFRVNTDTQYDQSMPVTATLADGSVVMVWTDWGRTPEAALSYQHFDALGNLIGGQTTIAGSTALYEPASIAPLADGGFVVSWQTYGGNIHLQRFASNGGAVGGETQVNPAHAGVDPVQHQDNEAVTGMPDGGWIVTWRSETDPSTGYQSVYSQRYDASGAPVGQQPLIVESVPHAPLGDSSITSLLSGGYVVAWNHDGEVVQRRYDAGGQPAGDGSPQVVAASGGFPAHVAALADGGWVVVYPGASLTLHAQRYDGAGNALGDAALVTQNAFDSFDDAATATGLAHGGYVVTWETGGVSDAVDIHAQRFDASGARAGDEFVVNTETQSAQMTPSVTALQDGGFTITWASALEDGMGTGIYAKRFDASGVAQSDTGWLQGDASNDTLQWDGAAPARLSGFGGNDTLAGGTGDDFLDGGAGNDLLRVGIGHDNFNGGAGVDTAVFDMSTAGITGYSAGAYDAYSVSTANGTSDLFGMERAQFSNGLFAIDTQAPINYTWPGGDTWWAASLWHLGFGALPGMEDLSRWTAQADQFGGNAGALAQAMVDTFAPGISNHDLITYLYELHAHTAPTDAQVQSYENLIAPSPQPSGGSAPWFTTQGDFLAYVARMDFNEAALVGFTGTVQQLDPAFF
jgi:Ca2+-binding RTX toxin-like protein